MDFVELEFGLHQRESETYTTSALLPITDVA